LSTAHSMQAQVLLALVVLVGSAHASQQLGNPRHTKADVKTHQNTLLQHQQSDEPDVGGTDALTDEAVVAGNFGATPVNIETLKSYIKQRGFSDLGLLGDLISRTACMIRIEASVGSTLTGETLVDFATARELDASGSKDDMLDLSCEYLRMENSVRTHMDRPVADIAKDELKLELTRLGFISTTGTKADLVFRLGKAVHDLDTVRRLTGDASFDTSSLKELMSARGLSTEGTTGSLLGRLAEYLVEITDGSGSGVSSQCNMILASSVCVDGGRKVMSADSLSRGLIGKWTFDDAIGQDRSGLGHHAAQPPASGPGFNGNGMSAYFDGSSTLEIPHSDHFASQDFCVTMWLYLLEDYNGKWRTLIHKGNRDHERTPTLFLEPETRGLEFFVSTSDTSQPAGERLWSNTFVPLRKWTHIAACAEGRNMRLFINGLLDAENTTIGVPILNQGQMYVGNDPWRMSPGGVRSYIDELRYYARSLSTDEIQAQSQAGLGGVEPSFVELGCMGCNLAGCPSTCRRGYRLCTTRDMHGGAYQVARGMGWANAETRLWTAEDVRDGADTPDAAGLCVCCREEE